MIWLKFEKKEYLEVEVALDMNFTWRKSWSGGLDCEANIYQNNLQLLFSLLLKKSSKERNYSNLVGILLNMHFQLPSSSFLVILKKTGDVRLGLPFLFLIFSCLDSSLYQLILLSLETLYMPIRQLQSIVWSLNWFVTFDLFMDQCVFVWVIFFYFEKLLSI